MRRLQRWAEVPIYVPRWVLTLKYAMFVVLGIVAIVLGIPTLSLTSWDGYTSMWGAVLAASALTAAVASVHRRWEVWERWGAVGVMATMISYAVSALWLALGEGHAGRAAFAWALLIVSLFPSVRAAQLILRSGQERG